MLIYYGLYMHKLKKLIICFLSKFCAIDSHNNNNNNGEVSMAKSNDNFSVEQIENALTHLSDNFNISSTYLLASHHARVPAVLNLSYKRAYQEAGMSDKSHNLTAFGKAVFNHLEEEHAKTGKPMPNYLPQVASFDL